MPRFLWRQTFPHNPDDKTASIDGHPGAYIRVYHLTGTRPDGKTWAWTVAAERQIASGWEEDGRTAAEMAIKAWDRFVQLSSNET
jgi:hypothetical protein